MSASLQSKRIGVRAIGALTLLVVLAACRDTTLVPPRSLQSPTAMAVARGTVCLSTFEGPDRVVQFSIDRCGPGERGAIGLVTNEQSDRLALVDLGRSTPRLVDLDPATPGPNHIKVGRMPVDVAASVDGTVAYTLNQLDRDVSIVDLLTQEVHPERYAIDDTPIAMEVRPVTGEVVVAAGSPSTLYSFAPTSFCHPGDECVGDPIDPRDVVPETLELPGTVTDFVFHPSGDEAWVVYREFDFATTVSFGETPDGFESPCLNGGDEKPCITTNVSLTYGCSDGLDNDGDGLVDQQDPQCFGPRGAESPGGITREAEGPCSNGIDDDGDGLIDRDDPACIVPTDSEEGSTTFDEPPVATCNDGADNDGDGRIDYPDDGDCYGPFGRTESDISKRGFQAIGVDTHGLFFYVVERTGEQVLVVDGRRKALIDAPASQIPSSAPLDQDLGVDVAPSPLDVHGAIDRRVVWRDDANEDHVIVRYDFGAWISANNGSLQYVDTAVSFCEFTGHTVSARNFWRRRESEIEAKCLDLPPLPLASATTRVVARAETLPDDCLTESFVACAECLEGDEEVCEACDTFADTQFDLCQRAYETEDTKLYLNPRFGLRDVGGADGRLLGKGTCEQPGELVEQMQEFAGRNPNAPQGLQCDSPLSPQPLSTQARLADDVSTLADLPRADLFELRTLQFDTTANNEPLVGFRPADQRILTEPLTVTYEGEIPGTVRRDAVLGEEPLEDGTIWVDVGFNPCNRGVEPGDRLIFTSESNDECDLGDEPEFEIVEVTDSEVRIAPLRNTDSVPVRACFDTAAGYRVIVSNEWVVVGASSGFFSPSTAVHGRCVPRFGSEGLSSRVATGELFRGPYYDFYLYPGFAPDEISPIRDTTFTFQSSSGFEPAIFQTCSSLGQECSAGLYPAQVLWVPGLPNGTMLMSPDPNDNFIHIRNLDDRAGGFAVLR